MHSLPLRPTILGGRRVSKQDPGAPRSVFFCPSGCSSGAVQGGLPALLRVLRRRCAKPRKPMFREGYPATKKFCNVEAPSVRIVLHRTAGNGLCLLAGAVDGAWATTPCASKISRRK